MLRLVESCHTAIVTYPMCAKNTAPVVCNGPYRSLRSGIVLLFNSARKPLRMNRCCIKVRGGIAKVYRGGSPLSKPSGEEYGRVLSFSAYYHEESKKQLVKVRLFKILFFIKGYLSPRILVLLVSLNWLNDKIWFLDIYNVSTTSSFYLEV